MFWCDAINTRSTICPVRPAVERGDIKADMANARNCNQFWGKREGPKRQDSLPTRGHAQLGFEHMARVVLFFSSEGTVEFKTAIGSDWRHTLCDPFQMSLVYNSARARKKETEVGTDLRVKSVRRARWRDSAMLGPGGAILTCYVPAAPPRGVRENFMNEQHKNLFFFASLFTEREELFLCSFSLTPVQKKVWD